MQKIDSLTGIRGIAALWVLLFHFRNMPGILNIIDLNWLARRGYWGVDFFFVLSGFVLSYNYFSEFNSLDFGLAEYKRFLVKRLARIYPLHLFTLLIYVLLLFVSYRVGQTIVLGSCSLTGAVGNILLIHGWGFFDSLTWNYPSWSISAEWFAYLVILLVALRYFTRVDRVYQLLAVAIMWACLITYSLYIGETMSHFSYNALPRVTVEFLAGCLLYRMVRGQRQTHLANLIFLMGFGSVAVLTQLGSNYEFLLLPLVILSIYSLWIGGSLGKAIFGNRIVVFLGEISYSIYLMHMIVQTVGSFVIRNSNFPTTAVTAWLILGINTSAVLILSVATYYLIERPSRRALINIYDKLRLKYGFL